MRAEEKRKRVLEKYEEMLGRNYYSQNLSKRECALTPYKDGLYYSDCSSSIRIAYKAADVGCPNIGGNTAGIHYAGKKVSVTIRNGQVTDETQLRPGDCLLFRGNDPSRPLQIGHVEMYAGAGKIYGHGSGRPSCKTMTDYLASRERQRARNGLSRGLVEVRRFIPDDTAFQSVPVTTSERGIEVLSDLNIRETPAGHWVGMYEKGEVVRPVARTTYEGAPWVQTDKGWVSGRYLRGWLKEGGRWWYLDDGYRYPYATVQLINGAYYAFDADGWMITADRIDSDGKII